MTYVLMAAGSWFLAGLLAYSAIDKILHWSLFVKALTMYQVIPRIFLPVVTYGVPVLEMATALAIALPWCRARGLEFAAWLLAGFTVMTGYAAIVAPGIPCGCMFTLGPTRATFGHVVLNVILTALAWMLASLSSARVPESTLEGTV
jgi:hypothetical protein